MRQNSFVKQIWPEGTADGEVEGRERVLPDRGDNVQRITDVTTPTLTLFPAESSNKNVSPAALIFPGGGYNMLGINKEGSEIADWLTGLGITAIVVKYRVPGNRVAAYQDAQRSMRVTRHHAREWNVNPQRIGVIGFSAGAHLCARLSTDLENICYTRVDEADKGDCRPDFCILIYPACLADTKTKQVAPELPITRNVPPTFIVQTKDDRSFIDGTTAYHEALKQVGVSSCFHLFEEGGHGYGLRSSKYKVSQWPKLCERWLKENALINNTSHQPG